ncbi:MAG: pyridoxamine 5'-phosphate oxidase family protein [Anaerolineae bacterium]|nr:pyridoxamine 5'-phosphate oxidase family protein [Anaerolineae bacterium]
MAKVYYGITDELQAFIAGQHVFFVGSAPLSCEGHVNLSPKGLDSFRILSPHRVAYIDMAGSGNETSAHLLENGRITFMFCAFDGPPNILRLFGTGHAILPDQPEWSDLALHFTMRLGVRQIIVADITRVQTSCGYGVPLYEYAGERDHLIRWAEKKGQAGLDEYQQDHNLVSIDGLPTALGTRKYQ